MVFLIHTELRCTVNHTSEANLDRPDLTLVNAIIHFYNNITVRAISAIIRAVLYSLTEQKQVDIISRSDIRRIYETQRGWHMNRDLVFLKYIITVSRRKVLWQKIKFLTGHAVI